MKRFFIVLTLAILAMIVSANAVYAKSVALAEESLSPEWSEVVPKAEAAPSLYDFDISGLKLEFVAIPKSATRGGHDFDIPGLKLNSIDELPALPDLRQLAPLQKRPSQQSLLNRIKNDFNNDVWKARREVEKLIKDNLVGEAFWKWLQTIDKFKKTVQDFSEDFEPGTFDKFIEALDKCRNDTFLIISKPYIQELSRCVSDMEVKDPDWGAIANSLEGFYRIKPTLSLSTIEKLEEMLETIRAQLKYHVKRHFLIEESIKKRVESILELWGTYLSDLLYDQAVKLYQESKYRDALELIGKALKIKPDNNKCLELRDRINFNQWKRSTNPNGMPFANPYEKQSQ